ncbi:MAG: T9SS type A sorting domain-containing protein [Bacteroidota bacterium]
MKKTYLLFFMVMLFAFNVSFIRAQHMVVNQVIVGSGGVYGDTTNNVALASYKPNDGVTTSFGNIDTQSIQDIVISGNFAFVAAQDSIAKFDIDTYEKVAIVEALGVNRLVVSGNVLLASFQWPATENFVKIFSTSDLALVSNIADVSDESAGILVAGNLAYVAVPGGYLSTTGKIAIIDLSNYSLIDEINFNEQGVGVNDLFYYDNQIMSVCRTPWGVTFGYLLAMNTIGSHTDVYLVDAVLGKMVGEIDGLLFTVMNNGVGVIDLSDFSVADTAYIEASTLTIAGVAMDTIDGVFYITTTDFFSTGIGTIYNALGIEIGNFDAGISADAIAIDYRDNTGIDDLLTNGTINIYPNPASYVITIDASDGIGISANTFSVVDISGRIIINGSVNMVKGSANINISTLKSGLYFFVLSNGNESITKSFVKK